MSEQTPYEQLGLTEDSSFDEIQSARNRLCAQHEGDAKQLEKIEAAYDAVLMDRLRMRQEGKIKVPDRIRFAEKLSPPAPASTPTTQRQTPQWLQRLIDTPSRADILLPAGAMSALIALVVLAPVGSAASAVQLALLVGLGATFYFLFRKEKKFWRTVLLGFTGLVAGLSIGLGIFNGLWSAGVRLPISLEAFASAVAFFVLWLVSSFLK